MIVTNNQRVAKSWAECSLYIDGGIDLLYQKVRDLVYEGYQLYTHPLSASIGMLHSPVKSIILSDTKLFDQESMKLISESIEKYQTLIGERKLKVDRQDDYEILDFELTKSALEELRNFGKDEKSEA